MKLSDIKWEHKPKDYWDVADIEDYLMYKSPDDPDPTRHNGCRFLVFDKREEGSDPGYTEYKTTLEFACFLSTIDLPRR